MESRPSDSSVAKAPAVISTFSSASFHSRLTVSSSSSQRRLRALSRASSDEKAQVDVIPERSKSLSFLRGLTPSPQPAKELPLYVSEKQRLPPLAWRHLVYWLIYVYCLFSFSFFTGGLFDIHKKSDLVIATNVARHVSPINDFSQPYRLSRLLPIDSGVEDFHPYVSYAYRNPEENNITACMWGVQDDLEKFELWSSGWQGPLSVVIVYDNFEQEKLVVKSLKKLSGLQEKAHVHIVRRNPNIHHNGNIYLNLARLFARTRYVALIPAPPSQQIPHGLYSRIQDKVNAYNKSMLAAPYVLSPSRHTIPTSPVPFAPLSPLLIEQASPIWCTERFFTASTRETHWEECLWQFWLASYGTLSILPESGLKLPSRPKTSTGGPVNPEEIIHRRLSNRFRHESCVLAAKRLKDRSSPAKVDPKKSRWLRETCRQAMSH